MIVRARLILPLGRPAIEDGGLAIVDGRIAGVGPWKELQSRFPGMEAIDLGETVVLPGLINAHCHLDYTDMAGQIEPVKSFTDWIKSITSLKADWSYADYAQSWLAGAQMLVQSGTTTVADIEAVPELIPEVWESTPLRVMSFFEMTGVKSRRAPELILQDAVKKIHSLGSGRSSGHLSPHAPYSTTPELLNLSAKAAQEHDWRVTTHVAESDEEFEMFLYSRGVMHDWLKRNGRDMADCGYGSPVRRLEQQGLLNERFLAVHVNYLWTGDAELLGARKVSVVHCPRSHAYFHHHRFPRRELSHAGVNICLGTDSLVTVSKKRGDRLELNMFLEMAALAAGAPDLAPQEILRMATVNGARALGMAGETGELREEAHADFIALPFTGNLNEVYERIVHHTGPVWGSAVAGQWVIKPDGI